MQTESATNVRTVAQSANGRTGGKGWKLQKTATKRSHLMPGVKAKSWDERMLKRTKLEALKKVERDMRDETKREEEATRQRLKERRERHAERKREEEMRARMSAKKLQRMKKRLGRTKKVNG
ncbi:hypothetical protein HD553DRAFT_274859 [Filobasidium floriforme]|uniref:uncharacterized protein n=1 Tax=Filobasidium floriforme TaxID=5210 RepID=UPI001E8D9DA1|nr:uncharacterized protein HD553DRAFT_274859 [Filobasidium floriforme]KAH8081925.1 hypothetical protein HD553DRAFT_274859 [Filobasidium floriforme]